MAHFYGDIQGNRGGATRMGTVKTGFSGHIRGWNVGCRVYMSVDSDGKDVCTVYKTTGSNGHGTEELIGRFVEGE